VAAFNLGRSRRFGWRILDYKVVKPVWNPGSVDLLAFGSVVNIPTILVLPINKITAPFHLIASSAKYAANFSALGFCCPTLSANHKELVAVTFFKDVKFCLAVIASFHH
jgi:hypothetical protein